MTGVQTCALPISRSGEREIDLLLPISVALLNFVIVKMVFSQDANHPLIFMMLGAVVALAYRAEKHPPAGQPGSQLELNRSDLSRHLPVGGRRLKRR